MFWNPLQKKPGITKELLILPVCLFFLFCSYYYFFPFTKEPVAGDLLAKAVLYMETNDHCLDVVIQEEGQDYRLFFEGNILNDGALYGKISDYGLELYLSENGKLMVKDLKDDIWKESSELGLESLNALVLLPFDFLETCTPFFSEAVFLEYPSETNTFISMQISPEVLSGTDFFKMSDLSGELMLDCMISVNVDTFFIDTVDVALLDTSNKKPLLNRRFTFYPVEEHGFKTVYSTSYNN